MRWFDPNGAIFWRGRYHLFYIFQRLDGVHVWGHASSIDLVHWRQHPTGLDVAPTDPDRGIFSGNAFLDREGAPTIMYHGVGVGNCIAQSHDDLLERWEKLRTNPIVPIPKAGDPNHGKFESWDPHGWFEGGSYYAIFGGEKKPALMKGRSLHNSITSVPFSRRHAQR
jgi:sucrose-6-phosphate hydrolase SacC (GH32 family)